MKRIITCIILLCIAVAVPTMQSLAESYPSAFQEFFGDPIRIAPEDRDWIAAIEFPVLEKGITIYHASDVTFIICCGIVDNSDSYLWATSGDDVLALVVQGISSYSDIPYVYYCVQTNEVYEYPSHIIDLAEVHTISDFAQFCSILYSDESEHAQYDATATPVPTATATPTPTPTVTPQRTWGNWSSWSTTRVSEDSSTQVQSKTQYRSRTITNRQGYTNWSAWSDWSTSAVSETVLRDVEVQTQYRYRTSSESTQYSDWSSWSAWSTTSATESTLVDVETKEESTVSYTYTYKHWRYYNTNEGKWMSSYTEYKKGGYKAGSGKWEYITVDKPLSVSGSRDGHSYYRYNGMNWYHQTKNEKTEITIYYRYRTRNQQQVTTWGNWSSWSSSYISSSSTCQVETREIYRYRTRTTTSTQEYGEWSSWSDTPVQESSTMQVETRTVFRYRKLH